MVCGRTGSGKSYALKQWVSDCTRLIVYGPKREEKDYPGVVFDAMQDPTEWLRFCAWWAISVGRCGRFRLIYRPADIFDYEEFERVCRLVCMSYDTTFVCEEMMSYTTERNIGPAFKRILTAGRTRGTDTYLVTQRPYKIPREVTSQSREAVIFATHEKADVDYIKATFGEAAAEAVQNLAQYEHVVWSENGSIAVGKA